MENSIVAALSGEEVLQSNSLGIITRRWVVVRDADRNSYTAISLSSIVDIAIDKTSHPPMLVVACGIFVIAAAAYYSQEGDGAAVPMACLGLVFLIGYVMSWRVSVILISGSDRILSARGSLRESAKFVKALRAAMQEVKNTEQTIRAQATSVEPV